MTTTSDLFDPDEIPGGTRRGHILDDDAIAALYARPRFTTEEREQWFTLSAAETAQLQRIQDDPTKLFFLLQLGYFHAKQRFFGFTFAEVRTDVAYLCDRYQLLAGLSIQPPSDSTITRQRTAIGRLHGVRQTGAAERRQILTLAAQAARVSSDPSYVFMEVLRQLSDSGIIGPAYTAMQDLIRQALTAEHRRLTTLLQQHLSEQDRHQLDDLLRRAGGQRSITWLKYAPKDDSHQAMREELERGAVLRPLALRAATILPTLELSPAAIAHYAWLVHFYSLGRLEALQDEVRILYLLCFVHHRFLQFNDHVITALLHVTTQYHTEATTAMHDHAATVAAAFAKDLPKVGTVLQLLTEPRHAPETPFSVIQQAAYAQLPAPRLAELAAYLRSHGTYDATVVYWMTVDRLAQRMKTRLRPLLTALDLAATRPDSPILEAVRALQDHLTAGRPLTRVAAEGLPARFVAVKERRHVYTTIADGEREPIRDRYEFLLFRQLRKALDAGEVFCTASTQYRSFEDDLLSAEAWADKDAILAQIGEPRLLEPIRDQLAALETALEERIHTVNQRIARGDNTHVTTRQGKKGTTWSVRYPQPRDPTNHTLFESVPDVPITSVLQFVEERCPFLRAFTHGSGRYHKPATDDHIIRACLVAWGTNMGIGRMGTISDLPTHVLLQASENYLRLETLRQANASISNAIVAMPRFARFDLGGHVHSSSDGQKFETPRVTFGARHARKYFGGRKGRVAYSLVANYLPLLGRMIGAHDHESHSVFDVLKNNPTDLRPAMHSTDTHGTNQVNFALLHLFGYAFAPRYKNLPRKVTTGLYGFQHPRQYGEVLLNPIRKINTELIIAEWDNLLRIFASLALKTTSQQIIVRKLNAYARRNSTRQALWEFDRIIASLYMLEYVDSAPLRQHVQRALNRGEQYHQLRRAVSYANMGKLRYTTEADQELWSECSRLLANCIIYYNMTLLDGLLAQKEAAGDLISVATLLEIAPIAWQHINFYGRYDFTTIPERIDVDALVAAFAQQQFRSAAVVA
ncbi:MAG: Tn3 family transposase [Herpetosiphonaceae bacterium]|nr:Tn3 family transposase [Herpetosiphonaceae bacterium]